MDGGGKGKGKKVSSRVKKSVSSGPATSKCEVAHSELPVSQPFTVQVQVKLPTPEKANVPSSVIFDYCTVLEDCCEVSISSDDSEEVTAGTS